MLLFHTRDFAEPKERVSQAFALVRFLAEAQETQDEFRLWMKAALKQISEHEEGHLYHDELAEINEPLYFIQFIQRATRHGLQYLAEADYFEMSDHGFKDSVRQTLAQLGRNRVLREQYLDFLKCRRFRQTLLCHGERELRLEPHAGHVADFSISSTATCTSGSIEGESPLRAFATARGGKCETDYDLGMAALTVLGEAWPGRIPFAELLDQSLSRLQGGIRSAEHPVAHRTRLCDFLLELYGAGIVDFHAFTPAMARVVSERPAASPVARWQARRGNVVTSLFHTVVKVEDEIGLRLLGWLDGNHDRAALLAKLWEFLRSKEALDPSLDDHAARRTVEDDLEKNLTKLAKLGLLTA
jgi:hypothetical protein